MILNIVFIFFVILFWNVDAGASHAKNVSASNRPSRRIGNIKVEVASRWGHNSHSWHFGYRNVPEWGQHYPECNGWKQSPIDLHLDSMNQLRVERPFTWAGYDRIPNHMTIVNNGHTVQLAGYWENQNAPYLFGGNLRDAYVFEQLHFHWGPDDSIGSEHTINNYNLPLEMHMVHYKKSYGSFNEAMKYEDGLAVIGIFFKVQNSWNSGIQQVHNYHQAIRNPGEPITIQPFPLSEFQLNFPGQYYSYFGSLTTPPCREIVTWIIPAIPQIINRNQMDIFRRINLSGGDNRNNRPVMPLNRRVVYRIEY